MMDIIPKKDMELIAGHVVQLTLEKAREFLDFLQMMVVWLLTLILKDRLNFFNWI